MDTIVDSYSQPAKHQNSGSFLSLRAIIIFLLEIKTLEDVFYSYASASSPRFSKRIHNADTCVEVPFHKYAFYVELECFCSRTRLHSLGRERLHAVNHVSEVGLRGSLLVFCLDPSALYDLPSKRWPSIAGSVGCELRSS